MIWLVLGYGIGIIIALSFMEPFVRKEFGELDEDAMTWFLSFVLSCLWPFLLGAYLASIPARWLIRKRTEIKR